MITAGDIEFEQPQPKAFKLGGHSVALIAGDVSAQSLIATKAQKEIVTSGTTDIGEIAAIYSREFMEYRRQSAEAAVLKPLGLNAETFLQRQQVFRVEVADRIINQLQEYSEDDFGRAIVAGVDDTGAHIYVVEKTGRPFSMDSTGFVGIGAGQWHAESQFMFSRYTKQWDFERAVFLAYTAKRRAEVAPGVGLETDMVLISSSPRNIFYLPDQHEFVQNLKKIYDEFLKGEQELRTKADEQVKTYVQQVLHKKTEEPLKPEGET